jgi:hypothetical protein
MKLISATSAWAAALGLAMATTLMVSIRPEPRPTRVVQLPPVLITGQSERASDAQQRTARTEPVEPQRVQQ